MGKLAAFFCFVSVCCTSFGVERTTESKKTTCYVYGVKETGEFLDEKQSVSGSVESDKFLVYVGVREEGSLGKGLVQVISKESGRPLSTNYFEISSHVELNTNKPSIQSGERGLITVECSRK